jgi:alkylated DNA repair dioxygenase AlkB
MTQSEGSLLSARVPDDFAETGSTHVETQAFALNHTATFRELLPGFVHMQCVLTLAAQQSLLNMSCKVAAESNEPGMSGGWYRQQKQGRWELNDGSKARFWDSISRFPISFKELGESLVRLAAQHFPTHLAEPASKFDARVGALNFYTAHGRMGWHVDDTNFAKAGRPIVMASLGNAADFGYKLRKGDADQSVRLESGDVIVFGGAARDLVHALLRVDPHTSPEALQFPDPPGVGRVSVTWRDAGEEDGLTFNSDERLGLVVTDQTLPRYRKAPSHSSTNTSTFCAQCSAPIEARSSGRGPVFCRLCWRRRQG